MKCSDLQFNLSLYGDAGSDHGSDSEISSHLEICPLCRQRAAEYIEVATGLRRLSRPEVPSNLRDRIRRTVRVESQRPIPHILSADVRDWMMMRLMPFSVGVAASLTIGITFLSMMFSGINRTVDSSSIVQNSQRSVMVASNRDSLLGSEGLITPSDYAQARLGYGYESPSVNPQGALIALTKSFIRGGMKDDEVVVVAEVFGSGLARIEEVVEPSRDREAVRELQKALQSDPAYAPFVPTNIESRPESVRVVLKFQSVDVSTADTPVPRNP